MLGAFAPSRSVKGSATFLASAGILQIFYETDLKAVCNENQGWPGRWHTFGIGLGPWRSMFFCLLILLSSLISMYFNVEGKTKEGYSCANILTHIDAPCAKRLPNLLRH
jgi:hypothetical protein